MNDIVLVTADSVRYDHVDSMEFVSSFDPTVAVTGAHYTRPSLSALHSSSLLSAIESRVVGTTIASELSDGGYTTIGLAPTPQTDPAFGFDTGFDTFETFSDGGGDNPLKNRNSRLREFLGGFDSVRRLYRRLVPMEAVLDGIPTDEAVIDMAIKRFNEAASPRFLWVHLMESHRPYGTGDDALDKDLDRRAGAAGNDGFLRSVSVDESEIATIKATYRDALGRVDTQIERLLSEIDGDPSFVFTSDHGDEFGEEGYFYHQGFRRRVADTLIDVPVVTDGFDLDRPERTSLLDVGPTILEHADCAVPDSFHGQSIATGGSETHITIAPWHDQATLSVQDGTKKIVAENASVSLSSEHGNSTAERADVPDEIEQRLRNLGYTDAG